VAKVETVDRLPGQSLLFDSLRLVEWPVRLEAHVMRLTNAEKEIHITCGLFDIFPIPRVIPLNHVHALHSLRAHDNLCQIHRCRQTPVTQPTISRIIVQHVRNTLHPRNDVIRHVLQSTRTGLDGTIMSSHLTNLLFEYRPAAVIQARAVYCPLVSTA
jgi:hypothetical protein